MNNTFFLIGRLTKDIEVQENKDGRKETIINLAVTRSYKNIDGIYETDFFDVILWNGIAQNTAEYCRKGDLVGVKGRLQTKVIEKEDGSKENKIEIIAEKVSFLTNKKVGEE